MEITLRLEDEGSDRAVILDDDGRVAYAYLAVGETMIADVWLYNVLETPEAVDWKDKTQMPFLNPRKFCTAERVSRISEHSVIRCDWSADRVDIFIDERWMARLMPGSTPGWSRLAGRAGPLAKPLED
jgi:hypothetical protein